MLKSSNSECQRKPIRINSYSNCEQEVKLATSFSANRLKCSTIARVPTAKSRLKQPVASHNEPHQQAKPSRLAKPTSACARPTSLALDSAKPKSTRPNATIQCSSKRFCSSILPKLAPPTNRLQTTSNSQPPRLITALSETKNSTANSNGNKTYQTKSTVRGKLVANKQGNISAHSNGSFESRLSGLKNSMSVVHPQHSQRVNSSATTTIVNKLSPTTTKSTITTTKTKLENGKVNLNHKDVNGGERKERKESKQDGGQIAFRHIKTAIAVPSHNQTNGFTSTAIKRDKNDQFAQSNNANHLLSVASSNSGDLDDKKQHGNNKQSSKHLSGHTHSTTMTQDEENNRQKNNSCYSHDGAKSTLTKSPAIYFERDINVHTINDRILPKPMCQQLLSLMMLDVGLMPTNNNHNQQPEITRSKRGHVHLQCPQNKGTDENVAKSYFIDKGQSFGDERDPAISGLKCGDIIDYRNYEQCNNYHSLQPTDEMLRLQVRFSNRNNENNRSISLPSSPRLRVRGQTNHRIDKGVLKQGDSIRQTAYLLGHDDFRANRASPVSYNEHFKNASETDTDQLLSVCDNQDSHSITSSSCSSLNHCPPLLALSNQLNSFKFEELVRANVDSAAKDKQTNLIAANTCTNQDSIHSLDQVAQVAKQHEILTNDLNPEIEVLHSSKIVHLGACVQQIDNLCTRDNKLREQTSETSQHKHSQVQPNKVFLSDESCSDPQLRRHQQPRSHSIGGQEYHSNNGYQRLKHSIYNQQTILDGHPHYNAQSSNRILVSPYQQHQLVGRSPSPLNVNCQTHYGSPQREGGIKYPLDRQPRNQLHASLECLNTSYTDYQQHQLQQQNQQQHLQQHQQHQQHQQQIHNQHYAASYVLATPPANTIINQNGDQDLAAAAMGTPPSLYHSMAASCSPTVDGGSYNHLTQNLITRAMAQVSQSPLRRVGLNNSSGSSASTGIFSQLSSLNHPMRAGHSSLSLASSSFIIEDKLQNEIRKLHSDLKSEKEKNEALNSQLNINSSLMAAFEQSLTTLNTRLRQLTTLNEKKDHEIEELKEQLRSTKSTTSSEKSASQNSESHNIIKDDHKSAINSEKDNSSEGNLMKLVEDLKRQLIEKDRLLTDTRLEALSAAHQLEQLESKLNGEHSLLVNDDDIDEGVMVVNHSPSDSDAITDSTHFSELNNQISKCNQRCNGDVVSFSLNNNNNNVLDGSNENNITDAQSNHSSDYQIEVKDNDTLRESISQQFNESNSGVMDRLMDSLLLTN